MTATLTDAGGYQATKQDREEFLGRARNLGPVVREHADQAEQGRRLAPEVVAGLRQAGLFRVLLPRSIGGFELDPATCSLIGDAQTLLQHGFLSENRYEAVGQVYLGVEPEFPMVAF